MGNTDSTQQTSIESILKDYREVRRDHQGVVLEDLNKQHTYFLKQFTYADSYQFQKALTSYKVLEKEEPCQNVLNMIRVASQQFNNFCSSSFKIYVVYEYPSITLEEEIIARAKQNKYFEECQLWSIVQSCANGLSQVKPTLSLHPKFVHVVPDGVLKIICNDLISQDYRSIQKQGVYYAPEKIKKFSGIQNEATLRKQGVFSLGMTILHAALLKPMNDCYRYQTCEFVQEKLEEYIEQLINLKYSQEFVQMLAMILQPIPNKRASLMQVHGMLTKVWNTETQQNAENQESQDHNRMQEDTNRNDEFSEIAQKSQSKPSNTKSISNNQIAATYTERQKQIVAPFGENHSSTSRPNFSEPLYPLSTFAPNNYRPYIPSTSKQNLFTDPKLLQMVRKDLHDINELKKSSMINTGTYDRGSFGLGSNYYQPSYISTYNFSKIETSLPYEATSYKYTSSFQQPNLTTNLNRINMPDEVSRNFQKKQSPQKCIKEKNNQNKSQQYNLKSQDQQTYRKQQDDYVIEQYEDGRKFQGIMKNGIKEGYGKFTYSDGAYYEGDFHHDKMEGEGTLFYEIDRPAYKGNWVNDQFDGYGILYNENPIILPGSFNYSDFNMIQDYWIRYEGYFDADNKQGEGKLFLSNGQQFTGQFQNDAINGRGVFIAKTQDGRFEEVHGIWEDNVLVQIIQNA